VRLSPTRGALLRVKVTARSQLATIVIVMVTWLTQAPAAVVKGTIDLTHKVNFAAATLMSCRRTRSTVGATRQFHGLGTVNQCKSYAHDAIISE